MTESLEHIKLKITRANEHVGEIEAKIDAILGPPEGRVLVYEDRRVADAFKGSFDSRPIPPELSIISGEAVHQMRSSLDHLVRLLALRDGGGESKRRQFPIFDAKPVGDGLKRYEKQLEGITRPEVRDIIEMAQPYKSGTRPRTSWLSVLGHLSNADKHRALVVQIAVTFARITTRVDYGGFAIEHDGPDDGKEPPSLLAVADERIAVKSVERRLVADVAFKEVGDPPGAYPVVGGLRLLLGGVESLVSDLAPCLS